MTDQVKGLEHRVARQVALIAVFKKFAPIWSKAFHANAWDGLLESWMDACAGIDTVLLEPAAKALLKLAPKYPPKPWEFASVARKLQHDQQPRDRRGNAATDSILDNARPFWFERMGPDGTYYATAWALASGGSTGIAEVEMDRVHRGELRWGWGEPPSSALRIAGS